ncbi:MAG: glycosyltransferase family 2 protein [Proteobacteria bacterium]|nr:MAG: glycosyltransferase family 2 protein [Pseudomonadota bacterium]
MIVRSGSVWDARRPGACAVSSPKSGLRSGTWTSIGASCDQFEALLSTLYIVITDFNGFAQTSRCLDALISSDRSDFHTLVVDHGTSDETRRGLQARYPEVCRIQGSEDLWWTGAVNLGVRFALESGASAVMLLNNDCYVEPGAIDILVRNWRENPGAIVAPVQRDYLSGDILSYDPGTCFLLGFSTLRGPRKIPRRVMERPLIDVDLILGGRGAIIPAVVFEQVGLFDEIELPHYGADHDFYLRARDKGVRLCVATNAFVDVDDTRTTAADRPGELSFREFVATFKNRRSHRNLGDVAALYRKHYPVPGFYVVGVVLSTIRYFLIYVIGRCWRRLGPTRIDRRETK